MTLRSSFLAVCLLFWAQLCTADDQKAAKTWYSVIHPSLGKYKFVGTIDPETDGYLVAVFTPEGKRSQLLKIDSDILRNGYDVSVLSIYDVDRDGYKDLVTINSFGAGPYPTTSLFRYNKFNGQFEEDKRFPGYNVPTPSRTSGCVFLDERISSTEGYIVTEWCLSTKDGSWQEGTKCASSSDTACYDAISKYQLKWHRKNDRNG